MSELFKPIIKIEQYSVIRPLSSKGRYGEDWGYRVSIDRGFGNTVFYDVFAREDGDKIKILEMDATEDKTASKQVSSFSIGPNEIGKSQELSNSYMLALARLAAKEGVRHFTPTLEDMTEDIV
ncbi:MAG: hypothetical protein IH845_03610 [Nanoarchaeota archaeon]|nr:hypothetical protein [Nanoarchaeota archaeon]